MALPQVQSYRASVANVPSAATPSVTFGQRTRADLAVQAQAQYQNTMGAVLDRLSANMFGIAKEESAREGLQFAIENPLTNEQMQAMVNGRMPEDVDLGNPRNVFDAAVRKHRAMELAAHADIEVREKATQLLQKAEDGMIDTETALSQLNAAIDGYSSTIGGQIDPDASYKFRASASAYGAQIITEIAKIESRKRKVANTNKVNQAYNPFLKAVELASKGELPINADTNQPVDLNQYIETEKAKFLSDADRLTGPEVYNQFAQRIDKDIFDVKVSVITNGILDKDNEIGGSAYEAMRRLRSGQAGKFQTVYNSMTLTQQAAMRKRIHEAFTEMVELKKADVAAAKVEAEPVFRGLQADYHKKPTPQLLDQMRALALSTGVVDIDYVESLPQKIAEKEIKNPIAEMRLKDDIKRGLVPDLRSLIERGTSLGIGPMRLNEIYSYKDQYDKGIESKVEDNARRAARLLPGATSSSARQTNLYFQFHANVNEEYNARMEEWETGGRKGVPPNRDAISDKLVAHQRESVPTKIIESIQADLANSYGVNGSMGKSTIDFKDFQRYMVYNEDSGEAIALSEEGKAMLRRFEFSSQIIQDIENKMLSIDAQERERSNMRLPQ